MPSRRGSSTIALIIRRLLLLGGTVDWHSRRGHPLVTPGNGFATREGIPAASACAPSRAGHHAGWSRQCALEDGHLTGGEIVVAAGDRELAVADRGGQVRFGGSQLLDAHGDIGPDRVVELITRLVDHALHGGSDPFGKPVGVPR